MTWRGKLYFVAAIGLFFIVSSLYSRLTGGPRVELDSKRALLRFSAPGNFSASLALPDQDGDGLAEFALKTTTDVGMNWGWFLKSFEISPDYTMQHYTLYSGANGKALWRWDGLGRERLSVHVNEGGLCVHAKHKRVSRCLGPDFCTEDYTANGRASKEAAQAAEAAATEMIHFDKEEFVVPLAESLSNSLFAKRLGFTPGARFERLLLAQGSEYSLYTTHAGGTSYVVEFTRDGKFTGKRVAKFDAPPTIGMMGSLDLAAAEQDGRYLLARAIMDSSDPYPVTLLSKVEGVPIQQADLEMHLADYGMASTLRAMAASGCGAWGTGSTEVDLVPIADRNGDGVRDWQFFVDVVGGEGTTLAIGLLSGATGEVLKR
jgi:hypothetical protein